MEEDEVWFTGHLEQKPGNAHDKGDGPVRTDGTKSKLCVDEDEVLGRTFGEGVFWKGLKGSDTIHGWRREGLHCPGEATRVETGKRRV